MAELEFEELLQDLLFDAFSPEQVKSIRNFDDDGKPEDEHGVIVEFQDGSEFRLPIEKSK